MCMYDIGHTLPLGMWDRRWPLETGSFKLFYFEMFCGFLVTWQKQIKDNVKGCDKPFFTDPANTSCATKLDICVHFRYLIMIKSSGSFTFSFENECKTVNYSNKKGRRWNYLTSICQRVKIMFGVDSSFIPESLSNTNTYTTEETKRAKWRLAFTWSCILHTIPS